LPEAVLNFMVLLGWSPKGEEEIFTKEQLIEQFDLERVSKSPAVFDMDKLNWMNNLYIKKADPAVIIELALPHLQEAGRLPIILTAEQRIWAESLIRLHQEKLRYAAEIVPITNLFFQDEISFNEEAEAMLKEEYVPAVLSSFEQHISDAEAFTPEAVQAALKKVQQETGYKGKALFMTVRVALTGLVYGPDLNQTISLLGKQKVKARIEKLLFS